MKVKVYVEGGGDSQALRTRCRRGFAQFFERAGLKNRMPRIIACGSRNDAFDTFRTAVSVAAADEFCLLLVDSESAVDTAPWEHLEDRDGWDRPDDAEDNQAHLMVQCMESWFLADRDCLAKFFGQGFTSRAWPNHSNVEEIPKSRVFESLKRATRKSRKGEYGKAKHSFEILGVISPLLVRGASLHAHRLLRTLDDKCGP